MKKEFNYNNNISIYKRVFKEAFLPNSFYFGIAILLMIVGASSIAYRAYMIQPTVDKIFLEKDKVALMIIPLQLIGIAIVIALTTFLEGYIMNKTTTKINISYQKQLFDRLIKQDMDYYQNKSSHKILDIFGDISGLMTATTVILNGVIKQLLTIISLVILMFSKSVELSLIAFVGFPLMIYPVYKIGRRLRDLSRIAREHSSSIGAIMGESLTLIKLVKSNNTEEYENQKFNNIINTIYKNSMKMLRKSLMTSPMMEMTGSFGFAGVIWYGGNLVMQGQISTGDFFTFLTSLLTIYKPAKSFAGLNIQIQQALVSARRLFIVLDKENKIKDKENPIDIKNIKGEFTFENINFAYPFHEKNEELVVLEEKNLISDKKALIDFNLKIEAGKSVALVGHSGSGKSTIFNLLLRFYDPLSGKIKLDNYDLKDISIKSLRENISVVSQDVLIFNASVIENVRYGKFNATEEEVIKACELANADEFIKDLSDGYETILGPNGCILSGGQKQRISIARAILKNTPILLLDEATSALDPISEKLIQKALNNLMKDKTTIIIAHRLSTIQNCDKIFVLEEGKLIEEGNHEELLAKNSLYSILYKKQFEKA